MEEDAEHRMEQRIWDHIDGLSSPEERAAVDALIAGDRQWQVKYFELLAMHRSVSELELEEPSMRFTRNVMDEIAKFQVAPATKSYVNKYIIRGIAALFLTLIAGMLVWFFGQFHWSGSGANPSPLLLQYSEDIRQGLHARLDRFEWSRLLSSAWVYVFLLINVIIGFVLLDTILQKRRRQAMERQGNA